MKKDAKTEKLKPSSSKVSQEEKIKAFAAALTKTGTTSSKTVPSHKTRPPGLIDSPKTGKSAYGMGVSSQSPHSASATAVVGSPSRMVLSSGDASVATPTEVLVGPSGPTEAGFHSVGVGIGCQKEYQYSVIRQIREPQRVTPDHFAIGSQLHAGKARWFSKHFDMSAATWVSIQDAMRQEMENERLPVTKRALQMGERYMKEYMDHWSKQPRPKPIACEYKLGPTALEPGDPFFMWRTARLDDVSYYPEALNSLCLGETKTTSDSFTGLINKYTMHPQILLQMLLWKMDPGGEQTYGPIRGVMLDIVKKGYGEEKSAFQRHFIPVPPYAMTWFPRALKAHLRILSAIDWDADVIRNPMRCTRQEGRALVACEFRDLCLAGRHAATKYVMGKGESLLSFKPSPGKSRPPWE